ncbi:MAG: hypothetical protein NC432_11990 [Roseburia sp.]|nr:hypothetical protein [Roseburia sp.]MCM1099517.1 hypothetical protein [Ruminococcus flavefaciens]
MQLKRLFSSASAKGTENYLNTQKKYEILRTVLYFAVSAALFAAGWLQTGSRLNLLTVVAVLGCLPASKSAVSAIMFLRFRSCSPEAAAEIQKHSEGLAVLYDCVFTSYSKNYAVSHLAVRGGSVCGFAEADFEEQAFYKHLQEILKLDGHKDVTVKIFRSLPKYTERLEQMQLLEEAPGEDALIETLKSVIL